MIISILFTPSINHFVDFDVTLMFNLVVINLGEAYDTVRKSNKHRWEPNGLATALGVEPMTVSNWKKEVYLLLGC